MSVATARANHTLFELLDVIKLRYQAQFLWFMKTSKKGWPSASETDEYRRRAKDAEHAAEMAKTAEAKDFFWKLPRTSTN